MSKDPKFKKPEFNLTNYETFVKEAIEQKERLENERIIPMSEECSGIIKQEEVEVPKKMKN